MSAYMDTAHYRVNKYVATMQVTRPTASRVHSWLGIELRLDDLETVVREHAAMREALAKADHFLLVIESAVRSADPQNYEGVMAAMRTVRDIVKPPSPSQCTEPRKP